MSINKTLFAAEAPRALPPARTRRDGRPPQHVLEAEPRAEDYEGLGREQRSGQVGGLRVIIPAPHFMSPGAKSCFYTLYKTLVDTT